MTTKPWYFLLLITALVTCGNRKNFLENLSIQYIASRNVGLKNPPVVLELFSEIPSDKLTACKLLNVSNCKLADVVFLLCMNLIDREESVPINWVGDLCLFSIWSTFNAVELVLTQLSGGEEKISIT